MSLTNILRNINGEFEVGRTMLVSSGVAAIFTPIGFTMADMWHNGWHFDIAAYCLAYTGGLSALNGIGLYAIGRKDRDTAIARQTIAQPPLSDTSTEQK